MGGVIVAASTSRWYFFRCSSRSLSMTSDWSDMPNRRTHHFPVLQQSYVRFVEHYESYVARRIHRQKTDTKVRRQHTQSCWSTSWNLAVVSCQLPAAELCVLYIGRASYCTAGCCCVLLDSFPSDFEKDGGHARQRPGT